MVKIGMKRIWASLAGCTEKRLGLIKEEAARFGPPPKGVRQEREKTLFIHSNTFSKYSTIEHTVIFTIH